MLVIVDDDGCDADDEGKMKVGFVSPPVAGVSCVGLPNEIPLDGCVVGVDAPPWEDRFGN